MCAYNITYILINTLYIYILKLYRIHIYMSPIGSVPLEKSD